MSLVQARPMQMQPEDKDANGNLVMDMSYIGLTGTVRFVRMEDGVRFSMIDVVKAFTGKNNDQAGNKYP